MKILNIFQSKKKPKAAPISQPAPEPEIIYILQHTDKPMDYENVPEKDWITLMDDSRPIVIAREMLRIKTEMKASFGTAWNDNYRVIASTGEILDKYPNRKEN